MPTWMISFVFAVGLAGFVYAKLIHATGDPSVRKDAIAAAIAGALAFIVLFTFFKFILNFD